jgi:hypothetical protein
MDKDSGHLWDVRDADGVQRCIKDGCTVRIARGGAVWQRKRGAHWRETHKRFGLPEPVPDCIGKEIAPSGE